MAKKKKKKQAGFTLVEVMVTMTIIAVMGTFVVINVLPMLSKGNKVKAESDINELTKAVIFYQMDVKEYPESLEDLLKTQSGNDERANPDGYIPILQKDPWGNPYNYAYPGDNGRFDIWSYGADGVEGGEGNDADITNWQK